MAHELGFLSANSIAATQLAVRDILATNDQSAQYAMTLSERDAADLLENRRRLLAATGRVEIGGGSVRRLIDRFVDSPYLWQGNYAQTLNELLAVFYAIKNEAQDSLGDDDLLALMKELFDGPCGGSTEYLASVLYLTARSMRGATVEGLDQQDREQVARQEQEEENERRNGGQDTEE